jgi:excisionase family DNA binding protein
MLDKYLTTEQVAEILQVHPFTILKFIKSGKIKGIKLGRLYRINENDVKEFLETLEIKAKTKSEKKEKINNESKKVLEKKVSIKKQEKDISKEDPKKIIKLEQELKEVLPKISEQDIKEEYLEIKIEPKKKEEYIEEDKEVYII